MQITRRTLIILSLSPYLSVWIFLFYAVHTVPPEEAVAGFFGGVLFTALIIFIPYFLIYAILFISSINVARKDFLIALLIVIFPVFVGFLDIKLGILH